MWLTVLLFTLIHSICECNGEAGWNDPNIVHQLGAWTHIPDDYYDRSKTPQPPLPYDDKYRRNDTTIIVLIAAFRETRCKDTLFNLLSKASHPQRVRIALVQQNKPNEDEDCVYAYCQLMATQNNMQVDITDDSQWNSNNCPFYDNIKVNRLLDTDAKGPVYARALQVEWSFLSSIFFFLFQHIKVFIVYHTTRKLRFQID